MGTRPPLALSFLTLLAPADAWAYIDPGTGSVLLQLLMGGALALLFFLKTSWRRLRERGSSLVRRLRGRRVRR